MAQTFFPLRILRKKKKHKTFLCGLESFAKLLNTISVVDGNQASNTTVINNSCVILS